MKKKMFWLIGSMLVLAALFTGILLWQQAGKTERLTKEEAEAVVNEKYPGRIMEVTAADGSYAVTVKRDQGVYEVLLDAKSGAVHSVKRISAGGGNDRKNGGTKEDDPSLTEQNNGTETDMPVLTEEEIKQKLASEMAGTISTIKKTELNGEPYYEATVQEGNKETRVTVNGRTGKIEKAETVKKEEPAKRLTAEQAAAVAVKEVGGEADDVELKTVNGRAYYFVEIETGDDREAIVQIDAITGAVQSVTWDD